jgi:hypothetical protein
LTLLNNKRMKLNDESCQLPSGAENVVLNVKGRNLHVDTELVTDIPDKFNICSREDFKDVNVTYENDGGTTTAKLDLMYEPDWAKLENDLSPLFKSSVCLSKNTTLAISSSHGTIKQKVPNPLFSECFNGVRFKNNASKLDLNLNPLGEVHTEKVEIYMTLKGTGDRKVYDIANSDHIPACPDVTSDLVWVAIGLGITVGLALVAAALVVVYRRTANKARPAVKRTAEGRRAELRAVQQVKVQQDGGNNYASLLDRDRSMPDRMDNGVYAREEELQEGFGDFSAKMAMVAEEDGYENGYEEDGYEENGYKKDVYEEDGYEEDGYKPPKQAPSPLKKKAPAPFHKKV